MAACLKNVVKVVAGCQRNLLTSRGSSFLTVSPVCPRQQPIRTFAVVKAAKKKKTEKKENVEKVKVPKEMIDDKDRHKPYGLTAWEPVDDVYIVRYYPRVLYEVAEAIDMLKSFQKLDHSPLEQPVSMELRVDMKLEKKKKIDPFVSTMHFPHSFKEAVNNVVVFTEDPEEARVAQEYGAAFVGGEELMQQILNDEVVADFYVAVPEIMSKLFPLKNKLRKKFPKSKRGTVGLDIPSMLKLFRFGHEYLVERDCYITTEVARLDMPKEHILANIRTFTDDVCSHKPASVGPFIERAIIFSQTSEGLRLKLDEFLPRLKEEKVA